MADTGDETSRCLKVGADLSFSGKKRSEASAFTELAAPRRVTATASGLGAGYLVRRPEAVLARPQLEEISAKSGSESSIAEHPASLKAIASKYEHLTACRREVRVSIVESKARKGATEQHPQRLIAESKVLTIDRATNLFPDLKKRRFRARARNEVCFG